MRGGKTGWYSPLLVAFLALLPAGCDLELKVAEPYLEVYFADTNTLYHPLNPVTLSYRFLADEPLLRCRYVLSRNGSALLGGETEPEAPGALHELTLDVPDLDTPGLGEGRYRLQLVVQAERSREFVDLAFLDKSMDFFKDTQSPVAPGVDLSNSQRFTQPLSVRFTHSEWAAPEPQGSPVKVYYTIDGTDPHSSATRILYSGSPVPLPFDSGIVTLKAIAEDEAGNQSEEFKEASYYFMHINSIDPQEGPITTDTITIHGFGFDGVITDNVKMIDAGGNPRILFFSSGSISENTITFMVNLGSLPAAPLGTAIISINNKVPSEATVTVPFQVTPP